MFEKEFKIPVPKTFSAKLCNGATHLFREVRIGYPKAGELYHGGSTSVFRCKWDWVEHFSHLNDMAGDTLIVELVDETDVQQGEGVDEKN